MFSRALHHADAGSIPTSTPTNLYFMTVQQAIKFEAELDDLQESYSSGMGCVRGLRSALAIEVAAALVVAVSWYGWHLIR